MRFATTTLRLWAVLSCVIAVGACSAPAPTGLGTTAPADQHDAAPPVTAVEAARQAGAGAAQLKLLEDGDVNYADYESAISAAVDCMRGQGYAVTVSAPQEKDGVAFIPYDIAVDDAAGQTMSAADQCYVEHAQFVDQFWQVESPDVVAFRERREAALLPALRECLTKYDVDWAQDETFAELARRAFPEGGATDDPVNCLYEIGYAEWDE